MACDPNKFMYRRCKKGSHHTGTGDWEECALSDAQNGMRRQSRLTGIWPHGQISGLHTWSLVMHFGYCFDLLAPCYPNSASTEIVDRF